MSKKAATTPADKIRCRKCGQAKSSKDFYAGRQVCKVCYCENVKANADKKAGKSPLIQAVPPRHAMTGSLKSTSWPIPGSATDELDRDEILTSAIAAGAETLASFGSPIERQCADAVIRGCSVVDAAVELGLTPGVVRAHLQELRRRAATRGYSPAHDMTASTPENYSVKGVSTYYKIEEDGTQRPIGQWVKTKREDEDRYAALMSAMTKISGAWQSMSEPAAVPTERTNDDLLAVYPMGDPHIGLMSWAPETGENFDLAIAEKNLCGVVDKLVDLAPPAREALVVNVGDYWHSDNKFNTTTAGTRVDVDGRWPKVLSVGIRIMRRIIDRALTKHEKVTVINEIGNHDSHVSIMLAVCLAQYYEREPRVVIDTSPAKFHWYRFGKCLIGVTHGDTVKAKDLGEIMACDRPEDWGETTHRYWLTGHIHHDTLKELRGVIVESFRTMAAADAWHKGQGYRSGRDMKVLIFDRNHGQVMRHTVGVDQLQATQ